MPRNLTHGCNPGGNLALKSASDIRFSFSVAERGILQGLEPRFSISLQWDDGSESKTTYAMLNEDKSWWANNGFTRGYVEFLEKH